MTQEEVRALRSLLEADRNEGLDAGLQVREDDPLGLLDLDDPAGYGDPVGIPDEDFASGARGRS